MPVSRCALLPVQIRKCQIRIRASGDNETRICRRILERRVGCRCPLIAGWLAREATCGSIPRLPCSYPGGYPVATLELPCRLPCGTG